jgi:hypothetical protein
MLTALSEVMELARAAAEPARKRLELERLSESNAERHTQLMALRQRVERDLCALADYGLEGAQRAARLWDAMLELEVLSHDVHSTAGALRAAGAPSRDAETVGAVERLEQFYKSTGTEGGRALFDAAKSPDARTYDRGHESTKRGLNAARERLGL